MKRSLFFFAALLLLAACTSTPETTIVEIQGIDSSLKPGDNFFLYVNHKWYDTAQIPPSQAGVGCGRVWREAQTITARLAGWAQTAVRLPMAALSAYTIVKLVS